MSLHIVTVGWADIEIRKNAENRLFMESISLLKRGGDGELVQVIWVHSVTNIEGEVVTLGKDSECSTHTPVFVI